MQTRRDFLSDSAGAAAFLFFPPRARQEQLPPVRAITRGPKFHWFGYYDKLEVDPGNRYVLGMETSFEDRMPGPDDAIGIGMVDLKDGDRWVDLGQSRAWCWQQGCMLQWRPGSKSEILWNDREEDRYVCRILDVTSGKKRTIPHPIYALSPDGRTGVTVDFARLHALAPGYGYPGIPDPHRDVKAPDNSGIRLVNLETGEAKLILSIAQVVETGNPLPDMKSSMAYLKHLLFNSDGTRFAFMHRWYPKGPPPFWPRGTRLLTARPDGGDLRVVDDNGYTSHFNWRGAGQILAWSDRKPLGQRFHLFEDRPGGKIEAVGKDVMTEDGHVSYLPNSDWLLNDTYPDKRRLQHPYLYQLSTGRRVPLGHFESPKKYSNELRCDTHPRFSPDGRKVIIDSPHGPDGRQLHLIDIEGIVG